MNKRQSSPSFTAASIALMCKHRVLLVKRKKPPCQGAWSLPGGSRKAGETIEETARRELLEETGLNANQIEFAFSHQPAQNPGDPHTKQHVLAVFFAVVEKELPPQAASDAKDARWFDLDEIAGLSTTKGLAGFVAQLFQFADFP